MCFQHTLNGVLQQKGRKKKNRSITNAITHIISDLRPSMLQFILIYTKELSVRSVYPKCILSFSHEMFPKTTYVHYKCLTPFYALSFRAFIAEN